MAGVVFYEGVSLLDGVSPIVGVLTGLGGTSTNRKTGAILQTWILRSDQHPLEAVHTQGDAAICGDCVHRGDDAGKNRSCYVAVPHAPAAIYRAYQAGRYPMAYEPGVRDLCAGQFVRLGAYGDPMAIPALYWQLLIQKAAGHTGYTHRWRTSDPLALDGPYRRFLMASVDTEAERHAARALGWRTFRTKLDLAPLQPGEIVCPASAEAGHRLTCVECGICKGGPSGPPGVAINAHGFAKAAFFRTRQIPLELV